MGKGNYMKETIITKEVELELNKDNAKRLQIIDAVILIYIAIQTISYTFGGMTDFGKDIIGVKFTILIGGARV